MKHVSILVYEDVVLSSLAGVYSLIVTANEACEQMGKSKPFHIELVGVHLRNVQLNLPVQFFCKRTIDDDFETDIIVVPGISTFANPVSKVLSKNAPLIDWLKQKRAEGVALIGLCTGVYFFAEGGLLDGLEATTHWQAVDEMQARYPSVKVRPDKITIDQKGIITGGGANSSLNTILYFLERYCGKTIAIEISKQDGIDYGRTSQSVFAIFRGQKHHQDQQMLEAQSFIEERFRKEISVEKVATHVHMSRRNFIRRFRIATGLNPIEYIQRIKIEAAKSALEEGPIDIASLTYSVGYNDLKTFRAVFKKTTGYTPQEYQKIYKRN